MTRTRRHVGPAAAVALIGLVGCGRSPSTPPSTIAPVVDSIPTGPSTPSPVATDPAAPPDRFAASFLAAVKAGTATPAQLTAGFKGVVAEPVSAADRDSGFSEYDVVRWLKPFAGYTFDLETKPVFSTAGAVGFRGSVRAPDGEKGSFALGLVKSKVGWAVDWFGPFGPPDATVPGSGTPAAGFAAAAFLDAVTAKAEPFSEGLMTPAAKAKIAPPFGSDKGRGYNRGLLRRRVDDFRRGATSYTLRSVSADGSKATASGELDGKPFAITLTPGDRPGVWLVDSLEGS